MCSKIPFEDHNRGYELTKLVIIDEAEKLKPQAFEIIREMYDQEKNNVYFYWNIWNIAYHRKVSSALLKDWFCTLLLTTWEIGSRVYFRKASLKIRNQSPRRRFYRPKDCIFNHSCCKWKF